MVALIRFFAPEPPRKALIPAIRVGCLFLNSGAHAMPRTMVALCPPLTGQQLAVKIVRIPPDNAIFVKRLTREVQILREIHHQNIVHLHKVSPPPPDVMSFLFVYMLVCMCWWAWLVSGAHVCWRHFAACMLPSLSRSSSRLGRATCSWSGVTAASSSRSLRAWSLATTVPVPSCHLHVPQHRP